MVEEQFLNAFPPLSPLRFEEEMFRKRFLDADDRQIVSQLYREAVEDSIGYVESLKYRNLSWGDEELFDLSATCREVRCYNLRSLDLGGNDGFTSEGLAALGDAMEERGFPVLRSLDLSFCGKFAELPTSIGRVSSLTSLNLSNCRKLQQIPQEVGYLAALATLSLRFCSSLATLPDSVGDLKVLTHLNLAHCQGLIAVPDSLGELKGLRELQLEGCEELVALPDLSSIPELKCPTLPMRLRNWETNGRVAFDFRRMGRRRAVSMAATGGRR